MLRKLPANSFKKESFLECFAVVLATSTYLPSAQCFAIVPLVAQAKRGSSGVALVDYDLDTGVSISFCTNMHSHLLPIRCYYNPQTPT